MIWLYSTLLIPAFGIILMILFGRRQLAGSLNLVLAIADFIASLFLAKQIFLGGSLQSANQQFFVDAFSILSIVLTTFVIATTAIFSRSYMWHSVQSKRISKRKWQLYHVMYQAFALMVLLALASNNIGILWVAMEGATLATVLLVSLYRTPEAIEAAWKYFILCIVGIALALFGTILVYFSGAQIVGVLHSAIFWTVLHKHATELNAAVIRLAFVFILVGYGTKVGLVPMHNWLPDAHSESPAPMSTLLSGLLLNLALYALIRFKIIVDLALASNLAGFLMMGFGLLSFLVAAILLNRQHNIKRLFSYSSIEHMGLITFGFGVGGPIATFAALFYMLIHSLAKSAIFVTVGNMIQVTGTQSMDKIRGLLLSQPVIGWCLLLSAIVISGFPPFGIFTSELMLFMVTVKSYPLLAVIIIIGLLIALAGLLRNIQPMVYGEPNQYPPSHTTMFPVLLHLGLVLVLGVFIPGFLQQILQNATNIILHS